MLIIGQRSLSSVLRVIIDIILVLNIIALLTLPIWLTALYNDPNLITQLDRYTYESAPDITARTEYPSDMPQSSYPFYLGFLYAAGLGTAWILAEGHFILRRLEKNQPFTERQSGSFRRVSLAFIWLALAFIIKVIVYNTIMTMVSCGLLIILAVIGLILSDIFRQAWQVKVDNDLTI